MATTRGLAIGAALVAALLSLGCGGEDGASQLLHGVVWRGAPPQMAPADQLAAKRGQIAFINRSSFDVLTLRVDGELASPEWVPPEGVAVADTADLDVNIYLELGLSDGQGPRSGLTLEARAASMTLTAMMPRREFYIGAPHPQTPLLTILGGRTYVSNDGQRTYQFDYWGNYEVIDERGNIVRAGGRIVAHDWDYKTRTFSFSAEAGVIATKSPFHRLVEHLDGDKVRRYSLR